MAEWLDDGRQPSRRRWWTPALVGVTVLVALVTLQLSGLADDVGSDRPVPWVEDPPNPGPPWPAGTWERTAAFDLPPDWRQAEVRVEATRSSTELFGPAGWLTQTERRRGDVPACTVTVTSTRGTLRLPERSSPTHVGTADATFTPYDPAAPTEPYGVVWRDASGAWADVACRMGLERSLDVAVGVRFVAEVVRVPVRLTVLPPGYRPTAIVLPADGSTALALGPDSGDPDLPPDETNLRLVAWAPTVPVALRATDEWISVNGRAGLMRPAEREICLTAGPAVCVSKDPADAVAGTGAWPPGVHEQLIHVAAGVLVADPARPTTWSEGRSAFPTR